MVELGERMSKAAKASRGGDKFQPRLLIRYALLQLPGTLLLVVVVAGIQRWWNFPVWASVTVVAMWVAKDVVLYPFLWRAYDWDRESDNFSMVGREGTVVEPLDPTGYVRVRGELWKASVPAGHSPVPRGQAVTVTAVCGLRLIVHRRN
ncbi:MAG TPA: NfeD family protein [Desulfobacterales bacterium]